MVPFRDASFEPDTFQLRASDVVKGVHRAVQCGALKWADFDLEWFEYCDHPGTADLHCILPGKFVAFKGPKQQGAFHKQTGVSSHAPRTPCPPPPPPPSLHNPRTHA